MSVPREQTWEGSRLASWAWRWPSCSAAASWPRSVSSGRKAWPNTWPDSFSSWQVRWTPQTPLRAEGKAALPVASFALLNLLAPVRKAARGHWVWWVIENVKKKKTVVLIQTSFLQPGPSPGLDSWGAWAIVYQERARRESDPQNWAETPSTSLSDGVFGVIFTHKTFIHSFHFTDSFWGLSMYQTLL